MNIKVDLSNFIQGSKQFAVIYIDPESLKTVEDVIQHICTTFRLNDIKGIKGFSLYEDIWFIPQNQSSYIFNDTKGIIRLFDDEEIVRRNDINIRTTDVICSSNNIYNNVGGNNINNRSSKECTDPSVGVPPIEEEEMSQANDMILSTVIVEDNPEVFYNKLPLHFEKHILTAERVNNNNPSKPSTLFNERISYIGEELPLKKDPNIEDVPKESCILAPTCSEKNALQTAEFDAVNIKNDVESSNSLWDEKHIDNTSLSVCSFDDSVKSFRKKRKRKHKKKAKSQKLDKYNEQSCSSYPVNDYIDKYNKNKRNCTNDYGGNDKVTTFKYKNRDTPSVNRLHKIFSDNEDENHTLNPCNKIAHEDNTDNRFSEISEHKDISFTNKIQFDYSESPKHPSLKRDNIENKKCDIDHHSSNNKQGLSQEITKARPPSGIHDVHETPFDVRTKFKNLLILESRVKPKIIIKERGKLKDKQNGDFSEFYSLPRSFASRKQLYSCDREDEIISIYNMKDSSLIVDSSHKSKNTIDYNSPFTIKTEKLLNKELNKTNPLTNNGEGNISESISNQELVPNHNNFQSSPNIDNINKNGRYVTSTGNTLKLFKSNICATSVKENIKPVGELLNTIGADETKLADVHEDKESLSHSQSGFLSDQELVATHTSDVDKDQSSASLDNYVGARPRKQNKRYFNSIGNALRSLRHSSLNIEKRRNSRNKVVSGDNIEKLNNNIKIEEDECQFSSPKFSNYSFENNSFKNDALNHLSENNNDVKDNNSSHDGVQVNSTPLNPDNNSCLDEKSDLGNESNNSFSRSITISDSKMLSNNSTNKRCLQINDSSNEGNSKKQKINFESYPVLTTLPKTGDIIATKMLTVDSNMCPCYSDYRPAKVITVDGTKLNLEFLDDDDDSSVQENQEIRINDDSEKTIDWRDLQFTRLIYP